LKGEKLENLSYELNKGLDEESVRLEKGGGCEAEEKLKKIVKKAVRLRRTELKEDINSRKTRNSSPQNTMEVAERSIGITS